MNFSFDYWNFRSVILKIKIKSQSSIKIEIFFVFINNIIFRYGILQVQNLLIKTMKMTRNMAAWLPWQTILLYIRDVMTYGYSFMQQLSHPYHGGFIMAIMIKSQNKLLTPQLQHQKEKRWSWTGKKHTIFIKLNWMSCVPHCANKGGGYKFCSGTELRKRWRAQHWSGLFWFEYFCQHTKGFQFPLKKYYFHILWSCTRQFGILSGMQMIIIIFTICISVF